MPDTHIKYRSGYNYQLAQDYSHQTNLKPAEAIKTDFIDLDRQGLLLVRSGYAWDGTSGPVIDTDANLRASLVHDALYQLMRMRKLTAKQHKDKSDKLFKKMCRKDGVASALAHIYYQTLKKLGKPSTDPKNTKKILRAPRL